MRIVPIIRDLCDDVEMIILFGSYARGDYTEEDDLLPNRKSGAPSDYDILVVSRLRDTATDHALWYEIGKRCNEPHYAARRAMPFRIIAHEIGYLKKRLSEIHYFFSDIVREGCLLYTSGKHKLYVSKTLAPELQLQVAEEHFEHWFKRATSFYPHFTFAFEKADYCLAAFMLHQAAESSYKAFLLVHTNYTPHDHFLANADRQARAILPSMGEIFPRETPAAEERFKNFDYAYIGGRYAPKFSIAEKNLAYFAERVKLLHELTEKFCQEKIALFRAMCE